MADVFCIAAFRSRLQVMAFEQILQESGVRAGIVTTPRAVSMGCGLSVQFPEKELAKAKRIYQQHGLGNLIGFYRVTRDVSGRSRVQAV